MSFRSSNGRGAAVQQCHLSVSHVWPDGKQPKEVSVVAAAISSLVTLSNPARVWAVWTTKAGSLRWPRWGAGASQGASVSTRSHPAATRGHIAERLRLGIGEIAGKRDQESEVERAARLLPSAAEAVHDAAQSGCRANVLRGPRKRSSQASVDSFVPRQWMRMGRLRAAAISSWRMSPLRCTSCGAPSW